LKILRVGLNGFGRIGRAIARIASEFDDIQIVVVNDIESDLQNLGYLLRYDSVYGRFARHIQVNEDSITIDGTKVDFFSERRIQDVPWENYDLDIVIEASGVSDNVLAAKELTQTSRVQKVVVTNGHKSVDSTIVMSVNDAEFNSDIHSVVSSSICDVNAIAPVLHFIDKHLGVDSALISTLHPWLSYQNLLDGPISSVASPGHNWSDYALGRSSVGNLIPKDTTAGAAAERVLPQLAGRIDAISYRVPTHIVSASDFSINLKKSVSISDLEDIFCKAAEIWPQVIAVNKEALVSGDFAMTAQSCIIDLNKTKIVGGKFVKLISWYDNEWAYSNRVLDVARLIG
jgi:glyceraldehyde 3-phosphate dehydrogenase